MSCLYPKESGIFIYSCMVDTGCDPENTGKIKKIPKTLQKNI
jgi:hypothetical protein